MKKWEKFACVASIPSILFLLAKLFQFFKGCGDKYDPTCKYSGIHAADLVGLVVMTIIMLVAVWISIYIFYIRKQKTLTSSTVRKSISTFVLGLLVFLLISLILPIPFIDSQGLISIESIGYYIVYVPINTIFVIVTLLIL